MWGSAGLSGDRHWAWPRWLQLVTTAPSYEKAAAVFLGDILKHPVFCQSFPTRVGEGFRALRPWLYSSVCPGVVFLLQCHGGAERSAVEVSPTKCQNRLCADSAKQPFTCRELQLIDHLHVGELALTYKTPCGNYTVCKKPIACSFTSESRVPPIHRTTIRNKNFTEEFNPVANN